MSGWFQAWEQRRAHSPFWIGVCVALRVGQDSVMAKRGILKASLKQTRVLQTEVEYLRFCALCFGCWWGTLIYRFSYLSFLSSISSGPFPYKSGTSPFKSCTTERYCTGAAEKASMIPILWPLTLSFLARGGCSFVII